MFQEMRYKKRELDLQQTQKILETGEYGILSTLGENGYPYGVPVSYACDGNKIYFHCAEGVGQKLANIANCSRVCFTVVGDTELLPSAFSTKYESAIVFGTAKKAPDKRRALELLIQKYSPQYCREGMEYIEKAIDRTGVYEIAIEHLTGKARK